METGLPKMNGQLNLHSPISQANYINQPLRHTRVSHCVSCALYAVCSLFTCVFCLSFGVFVTAEADRPPSQRGHASAVSSVGWLTTARKATERKPSIYWTRKNSVRSDILARCRDLTGLLGAEALKRQKSVDGPSKSAEAPEQQRKTPHLCYRSSLRLR